ncbi:pyrroloquinoline quinone-dependent dehydrogenase [Halomonas sp. McH1-25]|uniref:pyrroloquinoline quinone-dependent dehydrogenase n=1 Tax=unclassified Halomonas TaxID=2609666 RepID=UPI001EF3FA2A|nr:MULTISPECIES: pyrroloquinoline quinone-dependent dehydrogenase [unclassified Halomonas]MCG7600617.1 pyrroloquinoline quinone-dependent dehydrogenase [Halomonas sp. McH1-25]MCP1343240.1 pyrroloquinoline quinone-dependent dehydrogenase [Halomonas sp. FL8]MCP1359936.1 pyrroloquinoline quinone-dependent dehydrogenase [Halomonas sp. BBD45]MCP1364883.1 pyrroloquinoline quinone-dependent dehydrogenase [Halomonas sp. BBD48]
MPTLGITAQRLGTATALLLCIAPASLLAQEPPASQDQPATQGSAALQDAPADEPAAVSIPLVPEQPTWDSFHGQLNAQKYSPLDQITADNVGDLEKVWEVHTGDVADGSGELPPTVWSATPVFANDTLYIGTPFYRILALDPATGEEKWSFDTQSTLEAMTQTALKNRGVAYWQADEPVAGEPCQKIVYIGTMDAQLFAVDADTGEQCQGFANNGMLDVNQWNDTNDRWPLSLLQPPTVVGDHLILGWAGKDWASEQAPPGTVFSIDARTGEREWTFEVLPEEMREQSGTANVWTHMSADEQNGLVYLPVSSPSPNYWGGNRTEEVPLATSTTALDIDTGEVVWSRQWVHHDIWDYDINAAPTLMDITVGGEEIPALIQSTKQGFLFVVNRLTGEDVWPIEERPVPGGDGTVEGEVYAPTQPFPTKPAPLLDQAEKPKVWWLADAVSGGQCSALWDDLWYEGMYTPPTTRGEGTLTYPDSSGGVQWGGVAFDPESQTAIVNTSHIVQYLKLYSREDYEQADSGSGNEVGFSPQEGAPYGMRLKVALNWLGMPCWEPPYGEIVALDMTTGDVKWRRPVGASQQYGFFMPESWGSPTIGGPAVTAGGVIFIGASMDAKVRAYSLETGDELWSNQVEAPSVSNPAVYEYEGRQYVAFIGGGNTILKQQVGDQIAVYALPQD